MKRQIAIIGDSTVHTYEEGHECTGWGQKLPEYLSREIVFENHAMCGRSSKTFRQEGRWEPVLAAKPDYALIQFGHNDSHEKDRPEATDATGDFIEYMSLYVDEALEHGIIPIFITPPARRVYNEDGTVYTGSLKPYADSTIAIANEKKVAYIDLFSITCEHLREMGEVAAERYFCKAEDRTHFSDSGASYMAKTIAEKLSEHIPELQP